MLTPDEIRGIRSLIDINDLASRQANSAAVLAMVEAAYYIGHNDGQRSAADVTQLRRKE